MVLTITKAAWGWGGERCIPLSIHPTYHMNKDVDWEGHNFGQVIHMHSTDQNIFLMTSAKIRKHRHWRTSFVKETYLGKIQADATSRSKYMVRSYFFPMSIDRWNLTIVELDCLRMLQFNVSNKMFLSKVFSRGLSFITIAHVVLKS